MLITVPTASTSLRELLSDSSEDVTRYEGRARNILIQNKHATESFYLELDGVTAKTTESIEIAAWDSFSFTGIVLWDTFLIAGSSNNAVRVLINI